MGVLTEDHEHCEDNSTSSHRMLKMSKKIKAGKTSKSIRIIPQGDLGGLAKKTIKLGLEPGAGYTVGTMGKVKVSILADQ